MQWPVLLPGVFGAHELLHFLVIAGSSCHILFMAKVVVPSPASARDCRYASIRSCAMFLRHAMMKPLQRGSQWLPHFPSHRRRVKGTSYGSAK